MKKRNILICLASSAILTGASVTFFECFGFAVWLGLVPLFFALKWICETPGRKYRHAYAYGLFYFECFYAVCFHWFTELYPLDFTGLDKFSSLLVVITAWFGLSLLQALFGALTFVIFLAVSRSTLIRKLPCLKLAAYPLIYTFYEFTQTLGWWGVPWARIPIALTEHSLTVQNASLLGSYFITLTVLFVNALIYAMLDSLDEVKKSRVYALIALSVILFSNLSGTAILLFKKAEQRNSGTVTVGIVQGNYESGNKWGISAEDLLRTHLDYIEKCALAGAKTVVLCETALPYPLNEVPDHVIKISLIAEEYKISILVGSLENDGENQYNAIYRFNPDGSLDRENYKKRHLVPFGEYVPMRGFIDAVLPFLSDISMLDKDVTPGTDTAIFDTGSAKIGSIICFDSIYENLSIDSVRDGADLLAISTNDSWFGDSRAAYMHTAQARLRSVELSRYTVRSANTGLSCSITNTGEITDSLPLLSEGYLVCEVKTIESRTLYSYIGNAFVYLCGALVAVPFFYELGCFIYKKCKKK